jgi:hypothetical protein
MFGQELCHIEDFACDDNPQIVGFIVLRHFGESNLASAHIVTCRMINRKTQPKILDKNRTTGI